LQEQSSKHLPLSELTEDEKMLKTTVSRFATEHIKPKVKEMDTRSSLDKGVLKSLFDQGTWILSHA
jgi:hypothetical protein